MSQSKQHEPEHSILIVDDDAEFLDGARRALLAHGIGNVTPLQDSARVLQALATGTIPFCCSIGSCRIRRVPTFSRK